MSIARIALIAVVFTLAPFCAGVAADDQDEADVLALADKALELISAENFIGLTDLMIEEGMTYSAAFRDGKYNIRARTHAEQRASKSEADIVERGFEPTVLVSGPVAMVWYPYDIYIDGNWSHCGVDIFNLVRTNEGWRFSSMSWSVEQPPACKAHPDGPPSPN
jgi:hypothetical protein